jgi:hypothetical protein
MLTDKRGVGAVIKILIRMATLRGVMKNYSQGEKEDLINLLKNSGFLALFPEKNV